MSRATIAQIQVGYKSFDGLLKDGQFGVAVPQVSKLFPNSISHSNASKYVKRIMGKDFQLVRWTSVLHPKAVNVLLLPDFEKLLRKLDRKGDKDAQDFVDVMVGLSFHQIFCDSFGIKFEKEDRQEWLAKRQLSKDFYKILCGAVDWYWLTHEERHQLPICAYENAANAINRSLFGKDAKQIREELGLKKGVHLNRDHFGVESNRRIAIVQELASQKVYSQQIKPVEGVKQAVADFGYEVIEYSI